MMTILIFPILFKESVPRCRCARNYSLCNLRFFQVDCSGRQNKTKYLNAVMTYFGVCCVLVFYCNRPSDYTKITTESITRYDIYVLTFSALFRQLSTFVLHLLYITKYS